MLLELYCIYDNKTQVHQAPIMAINEQDFLRKMSEYVMDPSLPYNKWPADYEFWKIGIYSNHTGQITPVENKTFVCSAKELKDSIEQNVPISNERKNNNQDNDQNEV